MGFPEGQEMWNRGYVNQEFSKIEKDTKTRLKKVCDFQVGIM